MSFLNKPNLAKLDQLWSTYMLSIFLLLKRWRPQPWLAEEKLGPCASCTGPGARMDGWQVKLGI